MKLTPIVMPEPNHKKKQQVLELFFCSNDKRIAMISKVVGFSPKKTSLTIQQFFDGDIDFKKGDFAVFHSKMNY